jgi:hypothetical protein
MCSLRLEIGGATGEISCLIANTRPVQVADQFRHGLVWDAATKAGSFVARRPFRRIHSLSTSRHPCAGRGPVTLHFASTHLRSAASMPGYHSPPGERVSFSCVATAPQERREQRSWPAGRRAGARSQRKSPKRRPPHTRALSTVPVFRVREAAPGFADSPSVDWHRTGPHRVGHPSDNSCAASPRPRGPHQRASCAPKQRAKSKAQARA